MKLEKKDLDLILVPFGLIVMFVYHLFLLYRILRHPQTTVLGYENHNKMAWVERMLKVWISSLLLLLVFSLFFYIFLFLASLSITLSSLIGTWVGSSSSRVFVDAVIFGDTSPTTASVKFITLLAFFLVAFTSFIQSARYFLHASFLMTTPDSDIPVSYVQRAVIRGSNFWSLGLKALYFATTLLLWIFGPIPMFACSLSMVAALSFLDSNSTPLHKYRPQDQKKQHMQRNSERRYTESTGVLSSTMS